MFVVKENLKNDKVDNDDESIYLSVTRGNGTRLNSQVMIGGGCAVILQENLATEPCVTTSDVGWIVNEEIPATKHNTPTLKSTLRGFQAAGISFSFAIVSLQAVQAVFNEACTLFRLSINSYLVLPLTHFSFQSQMWLKQDPTHNSPILYFQIHVLHLRLFHVFHLFVFFRHIQSLSENNRERKLPSAAGR